MIRTRSEKFATRLTAAAMLCLALGGTTALLGCEDGPAEEAGEAIDEAVDDAGDALEDAGDEVEDALDGNG